MTKMLVIAGGLEVLSKIIWFSGSYDEEGLRNMFALASRNMYLMGMVQMGRDMGCVRDVWHAYGGVEENFMVEAKAVEFATYVKLSETEGWF